MKNFSIFGIFCILFSVFIASTEGIRWLALSKVGSVATVHQPPEKMCDAMKPSLIKKQVRFCKKNPSFMDSVRLGALRAMDECQYQFRSTRWNCSTMENTISDSLDAGLYEAMAPYLNNQRGAANNGRPFPVSHANEYSIKNLNDFSPESFRGTVPRGSADNYNSRDSYQMDSAMSNGYGGYGVNELRGRGGPSQMASTSQDSLTQKSSRTIYQRRGRGLRRGRRLSRKARHGAMTSDMMQNDAPMSSDDDDEDEDEIEEEDNNTRDEEDNMTNSNIINSNSISKSARNTIRNSTSINTFISQSISAYMPNNNKGNKKNKRRGGKKGKKNNKKGKKNKKQDENLGPFPVVSPGTKEMAFVHAISSAGVAHALTRACSAGELENCGCDRSLKGTSPEGFEWSGCSDNVDFGITFSRPFVDARDRRKLRKQKRSSAQPLMNLHNNEAGRKLLERNMKVECKCHGVSGSCELKTCWRSVAPFRRIGEILKEKFDNAHAVQQDRRRGRRMLTPVIEKFKPHTDTDLVYLKNSPTYCDFDPEKGSLGTRGRECNPEGEGMDSCKIMCCNRGFKTRTERRVERCKCKFHWCCFVKCEECYRDVQVSTCS